MPRLSPRRPERARLTHSVPRMADSRSRSVPGYPWLFRLRGNRNSSFRPVSQPWPCACDAGLPSDGSRRPRFPAVRSTMLALRLPARHPFDLFLRQPVPRRLLIRSRSPAGWGGPGPFVTAGGPCSGACAWTVQGLPGSLASHPVAMRTFFDPGRSVGASPVAAPALPLLRGRRRDRRLRLRGSIASLHDPLCTLHDVRCRKPCDTRSRVAGCALCKASVDPAGSH